MKIKKLICHALAFALAVTLILPTGTTVLAAGNANTIDVNDTSNMPGSVSYGGGVFTIDDNTVTPITITGTTVVNAIEVAPGVTGLELILNGVSIDLDGGANQGAAPIHIKSGADVTIRLENGTTNTLVADSFGSSTAGLRVPSGAAVTINGSTGIFNATGFNGGAGIGGGNSEAGGTITINGGTINAEGNFNGAGIGGGWHSAGGITTINGGTINAVASGMCYGAGIGGGRDGAGGTIIINGGTIVATGSYFGGAGIGGGHNGASGNITIDAAAVIMASSGGTKPAIDAATGSGSIINAKVSNDISTYDTYLSFGGKVLTLKGSHDYFAFSALAPTTVEVYSRDDLIPSKFMGNILTVADGSPSIPVTNLSTDPANVTSVVIDSAKITVKKNNVDWTSGTPVIQLSTSSTALENTISGTTSFGVYTFKSLAAATTYYVWDATRYTGQSVTILSSTATVNYYSVTLTNGTGIASTTGAGTYLSATNIPINAALTSGYTWSKWTSGGADVSTVQNYTITNITSAITYTANAVETKVITWDQLLAAVSAAPTDGTETKIIVGANLVATDSCDISNKNVVIESASGEHYTITRAIGFTGRLFGISSANLTLKNVTVDGNGANVTATGQIVYMWSGAFIMDGATIQNVKANIGGAQSDGVHLDSGNMTMINGALITNVVNVNNEGRGGLLIFTGTLVMTDSSVTNCSGYYSGGVYVASGATLSMSGSSAVTGNKSTRGGLLLEGTFNLLGNPNISGNTSRDGSTAINVILSEGCVINVDNALNNTTPVGISMLNSPPEGSPKSVTMASSLDWSSKFTSDDASFSIINSGSGSSQIVQLILPAVSTAPTATNATVAKTTATQPTVNFELDYPLTGIWKVYAGLTGGSALTEVTASAVGTTLTLAHDSNIPADIYYVSLTEAGKTESARLALTVGITAAEEANADIVGGKAALDETDFTYADGENNNNVKTNVTLPLTGENGTTISWIEKTDTDNNITVSGNAISVTRPSSAEGDKTVVITATISKTDGTSQTKDLTLVIKAQVASSGGSTTNTTTPNKGTTVIVNDKSYNAGETKDTTEDGKKVTTVTVDTDKLEAILKAQGEHASVIIPMMSGPDVASGVLTGQMVKNMETHQATLSMQTPSASYTVPASEINIEAVRQQFGAAVVLSNIVVEIQILEPANERVKVVEKIAQTGEFTIVAPPVEFNITCTYDGKTINVNQFNNYVERTVALPVGSDPAKITTGVVIDPDGTVRHVPTKVVIIDGKYYAKINSLTNSTYSVVWNPLSFKDVEQHWAKDEINDMGSRMVISGMGSDLFEPDRDITRAEFATILARALGLPPGMGASPFNDVKVSDWYSDYIKTAVEYKIISGYGNGNFGPNDKITREQAMAMVERAMEITGLEAGMEDVEIRGLLANYADGAFSSNYAKASIAACIKTGIITGRSDNTIAPMNFIVRAEVAVIVQRLLEKSNLI